jgi:hypothetical protein
LPSKKFKITKRGTEELSPPAGSQPLPRWARGHCRYPVDRVPLHISFKSKIRSEMCTHMPCSTEPCLPIEVGSGVATCMVAPDPASLIGRVPAPSCVSWIQTPPPCKGGLRCATCPMAPNLASLPGGLRCRHHMPCDFLWTTGFKHKEKPIRPTYAARHVCSPYTCTCFQGA